MPTVQGSFQILEVPAEAAYLLQAIPGSAAAVSTQQHALPTDLQLHNATLPATSANAQSTGALPLLRPVPSTMLDPQHPAQPAGISEAYQAQHAQQAAQQQQMQHTQQAQHAQQAQQVQQPQTGARVKASPTGAAMPTVNLAFPQLSRLLASPSRSSSRADLFAGNESLDLNTLAKAAVQKRKEQVGNKYLQVMQTVIRVSCTA